MAILDFKEIPAANTANGDQDSFELFAREFLKAKGFSIIENPDRGQDDGRDIIVSEDRLGIIGRTQIRWLVSCKHKAHSGSAVNASDEEDIHDRVQSHRCQGFMGVYSTVVSSPLSRKLKALEEKCEVKIWDQESIEDALLNDKAANKLIRRFFPEYYRIHKLPSNLLEAYSPLKCRECGRDLLQRDVLDNQLGIVVFVRDRNHFSTNGSQKYTDIYCCCKGKCDRKLESRIRSEGFSTGWDDISDLVIPTRFIEFLMSVLNRIYRDADSFTEEAFDKLKDVIIALSQMVVRYQTEEDIQRIRELSMLP